MGSDALESTMDRLAGILQRNKKDADAWYINLYTCYCYGCNQEERSIVSDEQVNAAKRSSIRFMKQVFGVDITDNG